MINKTEKDKYKLGLFIFTRDLRIIDNNTLNYAIKTCDKVIPIFIFTKLQITDNKYKSNKAVQFMIECLDDLKNSIEQDNNNIFKCFYGDNEKVVEYLVKTLGIDSIFMTKDYTPFSIKRETQIDKLSKKLNVDFYSIHDYLLYKNNEGRDGDGENKEDKYYQKFTPYYKKMLREKVIEPSNTKINKDKLYNFNNHSIKNIKYEIEINDAYIKYTEPSNTSLLYGGRSSGLSILNNISQFDNYSLERNILNIPTTQLSAYIKFGCLSIREVFHKIKKTFGLQSTLIKQLIWREFYYQLSEGFPHVLDGMLSMNLNKNKSLKEKYDNIKWINNNSLFKKWCNGETGFPIVDACMRQLNETGYMHNRGRLIVASFLIKNLHIDWRYGEKYFATKLIDYDPIVNNGNWQWVSGSGADSMPYFRIFNPWSQSESYDPDALYIKKWIPELIDIEPKDIHKWFNTEIREKYNNIKHKYPSPIINYNESREKTMKIYKEGLYK